LIKKLQDENEQLKYEIEIHNTDALHRKLAEKGKKKIKINIFY